MRQILLILLSAVLYCTCCICGVLSPVSMVADHWQEVFQRFWRKSLTLLLSDLLSICRTALPTLALVNLEETKYCIVQFQHFDQIFLAPGFKVTGLILTLPPVVSQSQDENHQKVWPAKRANFQLLRRTSSSSGEVFLPFGKKRAYYAVLVNFRCSVAT